MHNPQISKYHHLVVAKEISFSYVTSPLGLDFTAPLSDDRNIRIYREKLICCVNIEFWLQLEDISSDGEGKETQPHSLPIIMSLVMSPLRFYFSMIVQFVDFQCCSDSGFLLGLSTKMDRN